jgi:hypothetical protein
MLSARRVAGPEDENGAFLVIWVFAVVSILLFAALAIDLGNIVQTKQHAQDAADNAAISAVVDLAPIATGASAPAQEDVAVTDAESYVESNYSSIASSDWTGSACPNALPPQVSASRDTNCIGFFNPTDPSKNLTTPTGIAVAIPTQSVRYTFGRAGGLKAQGISALATASLQQSNASYLLPFGYADGSGNGLQCLKTGSGNKAAGCTGFAIGSGQFGVLNSPRYRVFPGSAPGGGQNPFLMADIDLGVDHILTVAPAGGGGEVCDAVGTPPNCLAYNNTPPYNNANYAAPQPGQTLNDPGPGLFNADQNSFSVDGCTISTPRLAHPDRFQATGDCTQANPTSGPTGPMLNSADTFGSSAALNGVHVTRYMIGGPNNPLFTSCYAAKGPGGTTPDPGANPIDATDAASGQNVWAGSATTEDGCLSAALAGMNTSSAPIFTADMVSSPRFGIVPVVASGHGRSAQAITGFLGVFLDMAFGNGNKVDAIQAWVFPLNLIQGGTGDPGLGTYTGAPPVANLCSLRAGNC